jgi:Mg-chelatase subunit ChlD
LLLITDFKESFCGGFNPDTQAFSNENILVILDASGSMAENAFSNNERKIDVAKKAVLNFLMNSKDALMEKEQRIKYIDIKSYIKM